MGTGQGGSVAFQKGNLPENGQSVPSVFQAHDGARLVKRGVVFFNRQKESKAATRESSAKGFLLLQAVLRGRDILLLVAKEISVKGCGFFNRQKKARRL
ncbi:MAG: hypothetical protein ACOXZ0_05565 [Eubacteriales bacterium]